MDAHVPTKVVLFDVDGVIYRNKPMLSVIKRKVATYVKTRIQKSQKTCVSMSDAEAISTNLYKKYGHTLRGMWELYGTPDEFSVKDFNDYVYDDEMINMLSTQLAGSELDEDLNKYTKLCRHNYSDVQFGIFSNAPLCWCKPIVAHYGLKVTPDLVYTSSHVLFDKRLKPDVSLFKDIANDILQADNELPIRFIDDSDINIAAVSDQPTEWVPVKFVSGFCGTHD